MKLSELKIEDVLGLHMHQDEKDYQVKIHDQQSLDRIRGKLMDKFGDVDITINHDAQWFDQVTITSANWQAANKAYCDKAAEACSRWGSN